MNDAHRLASKVAIVTDTASGIGFTVDDGAIVNF